MGKGHFPAMAHRAMGRLLEEVVQVAQEGGEVQDGQPDHFDPVDPVYVAPREPEHGRKWGPRGHHGHHGPGEEGDDMGAFIVGMLIRVALVLLVVFVAVREIRKRQERVAPHPGRELEEGEKSHWRTGLFECFSHPGTAFKATFCAPVLIAANRAEMDGRRPTLIDMAAAFTSPLGHLWANQRTLQRRLDEPERALADCAQVVCCAPCVNGRHTLELDAAAEDEGHPLRIHRGFEGPGDGMPPVVQGVPKAHPYQKGYASVCTGDDTKCQCPAHK